MTTPAADTLPSDAVLLGTRPFNSLRQNAARAMGLRFWSLTPKQRRRHLYFDEAGRLVGFSYPGFFFDMCALVYLCSIPSHVVHLAAEFPERAREITLEFAEAEHIVFGSPRSLQWGRRFAELLNEAAGKALAPAR